MTTTASSARRDDDFKSNSQYVTLGVEREVFAVDVDRVREILDLQPLSRVPNAPPFMVGMIDVRGRGVPVIDLRVKLGLPAVPPTPSTRILVMETTIAGRSTLLGLMTDRVFEVAPLAASSMEPPPEIGVRWRSEYIRAIARHNGAFVIIFNLSHLFAADEVAFIGGEV